MTTRKKDLKMKITNRKSKFFNGDIVEVLRPFSETICIDEKYETGYSFWYLGCSGGMRFKIGHIGKLQVYDIYTKSVKTCEGIFLLAGDRYYLTDDDNLMLYKRSLPNKIRSLLT